MARSTPKTVIAAIATLYFGWCAYDPQNAVFLHIIYTPFHYAGHVLFSFFGEFMGIAGGSLMQIIIPAVFCGHFIYYQKPYSAAIVLMWVGTSFNDVYVYAADAQVMILPLMRGTTGSEGGFHDWNYILTELGMLQHTNLVAKVIRFIGNLSIVVGSIAAFVFATEGEEIVSDKNL